MDYTRNSIEFQWKKEHYKWEVINVNRINEM